MKRSRRPQRYASATEPLEARVLLSGNVEYRSFDGSGNNQQNVDWGAANTQLVRLTTVEYGPGMAGAFPALAVRVDSEGNTINPRTVSNILFDQDVSQINDRGMTSFLFQWGQFLDHDMDLTEDFAPVGAADLPGEDITFLVPNDGTETELPLGTIIPMLRSRFALDDNGVAQQINQITSYLDGSNVYGSSAERADALRAHYGGFLLTSDGVINLTDGSGQFLPFNYMIDGHFIENAAPPTTGTGVPLSPGNLFIAGDVRANEQPGLTAMHTLFVREHNYQARRLAEKFGYDAVDLANPEVDERIYQMARAIVIAEIQSITYNEFLPALMGPNELASYQGYQPAVNAGIANIFSASLYRIGHTMLPNELLVLQEDGTPVPDDTDVLGAMVVGGQVSLGDAFFNPALTTQFGIEAYLVGLQTQQIQEIDNQIVDGVRNLLFDPPAGTDLGATNLQRGRDHGLPDYNQARIDFGLQPYTDFSQISSDPAVVEALRLAYDADRDPDAINNIDVFAGAIAEDHSVGGSMGSLMHAVLVDQFTRLRDGDRFFYENVFQGRQLAEIQNTRLGDIIARNTGMDVPQEVFRSADVFTYRAEQGRGSANVTLRVKDGELQITQASSNRVLASQALDATIIVAIYGTSKNDRIQIDDSVAEHFAGSVEVYGGAGRDDLIVDVDRDQDATDSPNAVHVDDLAIYHGNVEDVDIDQQRGRGRDNDRRDGDRDGDRGRDENRGRDDDENRGRRFGAFFESFENDPNGDRDGSLVDVLSDRLDRTSLIAATTPAEPQPSESSDDESDE